MVGAADDVKAATAAIRALATAAVDAFIMPAYAARLAEVQRTLLRDMPRIERRFAGYDDPVNRARYWKSMSLLFGALSDAIHLETPDRLDEQIDAYTDRLRDLGDGAEEMRYTYSRSGQDDYPATRLRRREAKLRRGMAKARTAGFTLLEATGPPGRRLLRDLPQRKGAGGGRVGARRSAERRARRGGVVRPALGHRRRHAALDARDRRALGLDAPAWSRRSPPAPARPPRRRRPRWRRRAAANSSGRAPASPVTAPVAPARTASQHERLRARRRARSRGRRARRGRPGGARSRPSSPSSPRIPASASSASSEAERSFTVRRGML